MDSGKNTKRTEYGDFQTPADLAQKVCNLVATSDFKPSSVLEPTCGKGSFVRAALKSFPSAKHIHGYEINVDYVSQANLGLPSSEVVDAKIFHADFFETNWKEVVSRLPSPLLVLGNPPWVTNSVLGVLSGSNLPAKSNVDNLRGIEAMMGKSNFDISEWMLRQFLTWFDGKNGMLAVLCKSSVARRVLRGAWASSSTILSANTYGIDSKKEFNVSVDAVLLVIRFEKEGESTECSIFESLESKSAARAYGLRGKRLVSNTVEYDKWSSLTSDGLTGWRSGIKHDCSKVFELTKTGSKYVNGFGVEVDIESSAVYPLLKSSDLAKGRDPRKWLLVPQKSMSDDIDAFGRQAPKAWRYLEKYESLIAKRGSSIYKKRHKYSIFGVGSYSFAPWKVAISGMYKNLGFVKVPSVDGKPVVFDDTCYSFPCWSENECDLLLSLLKSEPASEYFHSLIFWDAKRPITADILNRLDLKILGEFLNEDSELVAEIAEKQNAKFVKQLRQKIMFL